MANTTPSSGDRFDEEGDWIAQQFFSPDDLRMSPEEYAARHAHLIGCFALSPMQRTISHGTITAPLQKRTLILF